MIDYSHTTEKRIKTLLSRRKGTKKKKKKKKKKKGKERKEMWLYKSLERYFLFSIENKRSRLQKNKKKKEKKMNNNDPLPHNNQIYLLRNNLQLFLKVEIKRERQNYFITADEIISRSFASQLMYVGERKYDTETSKGHRILLSHIICKNITKNSQEIESSNS